MTRRALGETGEAVPRKVWSIDVARGGESAAADSQARGARPSLVAAPVAAFAPPARSAGSWKELAAAYLLGPFVVSLWHRGRRRLGWTIAGAVSGIAMAVVLARWTSIGEGLTSLPYGVLAWVLLVPLLILVLFTTWARAIGAAARLGRLRIPRWLAHPASVGALGFLVPGLGLLVAGERERAARTFWMLGPMLTSVVLLAEWRWLWTRSRIAETPGLSGPDLEVVFLIAGAAFAVTLFAWISQAMEGVRRAADIDRPAGRDSSGAALLVALIAFALAFRPEAAARCFDRMAAPLEADGLRVVPLLLWETAARIDPAAPAYLARAADLDVVLGWTDAAAEKRLTLKVRAAEYREVLREDRQRTPDESLASARP
jgi:hypothetical protein